jgi:hypothetical protein
MNEVQRLDREFWKIRDVSSLFESESVWGTPADHEQVRNAHISCAILDYLTVDDSVIRDTTFSYCNLNNCVLRDCHPVGIRNCRFRNCIFEGCSPPTDGKFQGLTTIIDDSKGGFKFTSLPTELKEKIMSYAIRWRGKTPPLIAALCNEKREKNRLETFDHELAVQMLSRENVYRFNIRKGKLLNFPAMRTIGRLHI